MIGYSLLSVLAFGFLVGVGKASYLSYNLSSPLEDKDIPKEKYDYLKYIEHGSFNIMD